MNKLIAYSYGFVSFLSEQTKYLDKINSIILFGSVARGKAGKNSDVDIFINVILKNKKIENEIKDIKKKFYESIKFKKYWKLKNITNEINIIIGRINNWKLKDSISGEAITLYEKYSQKIDKGKNKIIFSWENIKPNSKRVLFNKKIFGFKQKNKRYAGLLEIYNGEKLSKGTIMFDVKYSQEILKIFRKFKVKVKINKVLKYE